MFVTHENGISANPGYFLANPENCHRVTYTVPDTTYETAPNGRKYVPMGTVLPANGSTAEGILYQDIDVTNGEAAGALVTSGTVYLDRLPVALDSAAKTALAAKGFIFIDKAPTATR